VVLYRHRKGKTLFTVDGGYMPALNED